MQHQLEGGHVIKLGPGNDDVALDALRVWPGPAIPFISMSVLSDEAQVLYKSGAA